MNEVYGNTLLGARNAGFQVGEASNEVDEAADAREIDARARRIADLAARAGYLAVAAAKIESRVFGPHPTEASKDGVAPQAPGSLHKVDAGLDDLQRQIERLATSLDRLGRL